MKNERIVKVQLAQGEWIPMPFAEIPQGFLFRLYEEDGTFVGEYKALSKPWLNDDGVWTIKSE